MDHILWCTIYPRCNIIKIYAKLYNSATLTAVFIIREDDIFESRNFKMSKVLDGKLLDESYDFTGLNNFESFFTQFCILYGFFIWFNKFISVLAMRLKLQYNSFVFPVYLSFIGLFLTYHFYEIQITLFNIGNGETNFNSGWFSDSTIKMTVPVTQLFYLSNNKKTVQSTEHNTSQQHEYDVGYFSKSCSKS